METNMRYNFDKVPAMAMGFGVHADTKKQAWTKAYILAKENRYDGELEFRDNMKCGKATGCHACNICHP